MLSLPLSVNDRHALRSESTGRVGGQRNFYVTALFRVLPTGDPTLIFELPLHSSGVTFTRLVRSEDPSLRGATWIKGSAA